MGAQIPVHHHIRSINRAVKSEYSNRLGIEEIHPSKYSQTLNPSHSDSIRAVENPAICCCNLSTEFLGYEVRT